MYDLSTLELRYWISDLKFWSKDFQHLTLNFRLATIYFGFWTWIWNMEDSGIWTMGLGLYIIDINLSHWNHLDFCGSNFESCTLDPGFWSRSMDARPCIYDLWLWTIDRIVDLRFCTLVLSSLDWFWFWNSDSRSWALDLGPWTLDHGPWTLDRGRFTKSKDDDCTKSHVNLGIFRV